MDFEFSDEQMAVKDMARRVFDETCPSSRVRAALDGDASVDRALWAQLAEVGFLGTTLAPEHGGAGMGVLELCLIAEEFGRALAPVPFASTVYLGAATIAREASAAQKQAWLPGIAAGHSMLAFADWAATGATFHDGRISGGPAMLFEGMAADAAVVHANEPDGGSSLFFVPLADVARTPAATLDGAARHGIVSLDGAAAERIGGPGEGGRIVAEALDRCAVFVAFEQVGGADRALAMARDYALDRRAFGRPIGSFQAIKHMLADMYVALTLARSNAYYAAWALAADAPELPRAAAAARLSATKAFQKIATDCIQVHGGIGFTWEHDCHLFYRRANSLAVWPRPMAWWERRLVDALAEDAA